MIDSSFIINSNYIFKLFIFNNINLIFFVEKINNFL